MARPHTTRVQFIAKAFSESVLRNKFVGAVLLTLAAVELWTSEGEVGWIWLVRAAVLACCWASGWGHGRLVGYDEGHEDGRGDALDTAEHLVEIAARELSDDLLAKVEAHLAERRSPLAS